MEHTPSPLYESEDAPPLWPEQRLSLDARARVGRARAARIAIALALGLLGFLVAADLVTSAPALCGSCHEMSPRAESWKQSAHVAIKCVNCHTSPHPWYALPQSVGLQVGLLARDVNAHLAKQYEDPVDSRPPGVVPMADAVCFRCHDPNRKATSGFRILINHPEHAKRNKSCISCHIRTAHPLPTAGRALSLMTQCFTCHGTPRAPKASADCRVCHPSDFDLHPQSHKVAKKWKLGHGSVAKADRAQCAMCHKQSFCDDCHGLTMPHPKGWARGKSGHAALAERNRAVCARCHEDKPDLCSMCHHKSYDPSKGTWVKQHFLEVAKRGAAFCFGCHGPLFCVQCHPQ